VCALGVQCLTQLHFGLQLNVNWYTSFSGQASNLSIFKIYFIYFKLSHPPLPKNCSSGNFIIHVTGLLVYILGMGVLCFLTCKCVWALASSGDHGFRGGARPGRAPPGSGLGRDVQDRAIGLLYTLHLHLRYSEVYI
jgi:hypothetical protein